MKKLLAVVTLAVLATGCAHGQGRVNAGEFATLVLEGQEMIVAKISETEAVYVTSPKVACRPAGTTTDQPSLLVHYTETPTKKAVTALWSVWNAAPTTMPAYAAGYGVELCKWFNKK